MKREDMTREEWFKEMLTEYGYQEDQIKNLWDSRPERMDLVNDQVFEFATRATCEANPAATLERYIHIHLN